MKTAWLLASLVVIVPAAEAQEAALPTREEIAAKLKNVAPSDLVDSVLEGFYEVAVGSRVGYISVDGRYLIEGEVYDLETSRNITEDSRSEARVGLLGGVDPAQMIVFKPADRPVLHTITIFTDVDCGYCRQFHREIDQVLARGIEVHYLFYPRTGPNTESWSKAERVWCAADQQTALTNAKLGGPIPDLGCTNNPVAAQYDLGHQVGVTGTPSIYTAEGIHIGGYLPPDQLLETLNRLEP